MNKIGSDDYIYIDQADITSNLDLILDPSKKSLINAHSIHLSYNPTYFECLNSIDFSTLQTLSLDYLFHRELYI